MLKHGNTKFGVGVLTKGHQFHCSKLKPLLMLPFLMANTPLPSSPQTFPPPLPRKQHLAPHNSGRMVMPKACTALFTKPLEKPLFF